MVICYIVVHEFLFAAYELNSPSGTQELNGPLSKATTLNKSAVLLDAALSFAVQVPVNLGLTDGFAILSYAGITNTGPTSMESDVRHQTDKI